MPNLNQTPQAAESDSNPPQQILRNKLDSFSIRILDIILAFIGLVLLSPLFLLLAYLIKRDTPGPVFYHGARAGKNGVPFKILKFRTMYEKVESYAGPRVTAQDDQRITPLGKWLRDTKLNELPQLWNVLRGEMSIVGPRPEDPEIIMSWPEEVRGELLSVRPGITSPASVLYRNEEDLLHSKDLMDIYLLEILPSKLRFDQLYVRNRTIITDLDVILWTSIALLPRLKKYTVPEHLLYWGPISLFLHRYLSWFIIDVLVSLGAIGTAGFIWRMDDPLNLGFRLAAAVALVMALLFSLINSLAGLNRVVWSRARAVDVLDLAVSTGLVTTVLFLVNLLWKPNPLVPSAMVVVAGTFSFIGFVIARYRTRVFSGLAERWIRYRIGSILGLGERTLIVGTGDTADFAAWLIQKSSFASAFTIVGMVDDDPRTQGTQIDGNRIICQTKDIPAVVEKYDIGLILFAMTSAPREEQERVLGICASTPSRVIVVSDLVDTLKVHFPTDNLEKDKLLGRVLNNSAIDKLTGVWNRSQFLKLAENEFPRAKRYGRPLSIILIAIEMALLDEQSQNNGTGAEILQFVAECCKQNIRQIDILGRYEKNKFAILLPETDLAAAQMVARRLRKSVSSRTLEIPSSLRTIQIQIHLFSAQNDFPDVETMVEYAQRAVEVTSPVPHHELMK